MRRVEHLIKQIRRHTENEQIGTNDGISDMEFVQALNDAQDDMVAGIHMTDNRLLTKEKIYSSVIGQEAYSLPFDIYTQSHVVDITWTSTGRLEDGYCLDKRTIKERIASDGDPFQYILRRGEWLANPIPQNTISKGYMNYNPRLPKLDIRRGQVSAVTLDTVNLEIDALTLDSSFAVSLANALFDETDYITVVSKTGVIKMKSILIDSVDTSTGVVTVDTDFVYEDGETIEVGDYVVHGKYATTHSELPEICERYLLEFGYKRIFYRDSSQDWQIAHQELVQSRVDIIDAIASMTSDVNYIPEIINWEDY